jgi:hypothetical protein
MFKTLLVVFSLATLSGCGSNEVKVKPLTQEELATKKKSEEIQAYRSAPDRYLNPVTGKVVKIDGTLPGLVRSTISIHGEVDSGFFTPGYSVSGGGQSVAIGNPTYILHVQTSEGLYVVQIVNAMGSDFVGSSRPYSAGPQTIYGLASAIKIGTEVGFPTGYHNCRANYDGTDSGDVSFFSTSRIGAVEPNQLEVISIN